MQLRQTLYILVAMTCLTCTACVNRFQAVNDNNVNQIYAKKIAAFYGLPSSNNLKILNIKGYQQTENMTCGPSAVMSVLLYYHKLTPEQMNKKTELKIAREMGTNSKFGTTPKQMATWLSKHGFNVKYGQNGTIAMIRNELNKGVPVLVEWVDWGGHWVVASGYDQQGRKMEDDKDTLFLADPAVHWDNIRYTDGMNTINPDRFESMWLDILFHDGHQTKGIYVIATPK